METIMREFENFIDNRNNNSCSCGRGEAYPQTDYYGIYAGRMCDQCFQEKYHQDAYFDPDYAGESLYEEDY